MGWSGRGRANTNIVLGSRHTAAFSTHCGCLATPVSRPLDQSRAESIEKISNSVRAPAGGASRGGHGGSPPKRSKPGSREFFACDSLRKFEKKVVFKCITGINGSYPDDGTHFVFVFTRLGNVLVKLYKEPRRAVPPT